MTHEEKSIVELSVATYGGTPAEAIKTRIKGLEQTLHGVKYSETLKQIYRKSIREHRVILEKLEQC